MLLDTTDHETDVSIASVASRIGRSSFYSVAATIVRANHVTMINTRDEKRYLNCFLADREPRTVRHAFLLDSRASGDVLKSKLKYIGGK